jgi:hypothetical protein
MAAIGDVKHAWWFLSLARSSYCAITLLIRIDLQDDLSLSLGCMVWGFYSCWCLLACFLLAKSSYEDFTEHFSVSLRRKTSPNLLSVLLSRRIWWWGFHYYYFLVYARIWMLARFYSRLCKSKLYLGLVLAVMSSCGDVDDAFWLSLINGSCACHAPPSGLPCTSLCLASHLACPSSPRCLACSLLLLILFK